MLWFWSASVQATNHSSIFLQDGNDTGGGAALFFADGGGMTLSNINVADGVVAESIVSTSGSTSGGATIVLRDIIATNSSVDVRMIQTRWFSRFAQLLSSEFVPF